jgi:hypothetical protein
MEFDKENKKEGSTSKSSAENLSSTSFASMQPPPLQLKVDDDEKSTGLPYQDQLQTSFGTNDMSSAIAHTSSGARKSSEGMEASAYGSESSVVFAKKPDLQTAAHETVHTVQQGEKKED